MDVARFKSETRWKLWLPCFLALTAAVGRWELYPDFPLYAAWLVLPLHLAMCALSMDGQMLSHVMLMFGLLLLLSSVSWLAHVVIYSIWRAAAGGRQPRQPPIPPERVER